MRVTLVEFSPSGGLFQFAFQLAEALAVRGHVVELVTGPDPELTPRVSGVELVTILPTWHPGDARPVPPLRARARRVVRAVRYVEAWRRVLVHVRRTHPDVVQLADWRFAVDGLGVQLLARAHHAPVLVDLAHTPRPLSESRGDDAMYRGGPLLRRALAGAYRAVDAVLVLGEASRQEARATWPDIARVEVIPHGDEGIYDDAGAAPPSACPPRVVFFGTWARYKGLDLLLDAFAIVRATVPDAELVVAGAVSKEVDADAIASRAAVIGNVSLRPGYVDVREVPVLIGGARVIVAPYLAANQSGVVHLAQTFGRPVVATDVGDLRDAVRNEVSGLLVPARSPGALSDALARVLRDPELADRLGAGGRRRVEAESSWPALALQVEAIYEELLDARRQNARRKAW